MSQKLSSASTSQAFESVAGSEQIPDNGPIVISFRGPLRPEIEASKCAQQEEKEREEKSDSEREPEVASARPVRGPIVRSKTFSATQIEDDNLVRQLAESLLVNNRRADVKREVITTRNRFDALVGRGDSGPKPPIVVNPEMPIRVQTMSDRSKQRKMLEESKAARKQGVRKMLTSVVPAAVKQSKQQPAKTEPQPKVGVVSIAKFASLKGGVKPVLVGHGEPAVEAQAEKAEHVAPCVGKPERQPGDVVATGMSWVDGQVVVTIDGFEKPVEKKFLSSELIDLKKHNYDVVKTDDECYTIIDNRENRKLIVRFAEYTIPWPSFIGYWNNVAHGGGAMYPQHKGWFVAGADVKVKLPVVVVNQMRAFWTSRVRDALGAQYALSQQRCTTICRDINMSSDDYDIVLFYAPIFAYLDTWDRQQYGSRVVMRDYSSSEGLTKSLKRSYTTVKRHKWKVLLISAVAVVGTVWAFRKVKQKMPILYQGCGTLKFYCQAAIYRTLDASIYVVEGLTKAVLRAAIKIGFAVEESSLSRQSVFSRKFGDRQLMTPSLPNLSYRVPSFERSSSYFSSKFNDTIAVPPAPRLVCVETNPGPSKARSNQRADRHKWVDALLDEPPPPIIYSDNLVRPRSPGAWVPAPQQEIKVRVKGPVNLERASLFSDFHKYVRGFYKTHQEMIRAFPPAPRLVCVELNPGPAFHSKLAGCSFKQLECAQNPDPTRLKKSARVVEVNSRRERDPQQCNGEIVRVGFDMGGYEPCAYASNKHNEWKALGKRVLGATVEADVAWQRECSNFAKENAKALFPRMNNVKSLSFDSYILGSNASPSVKAVLRATMAKLVEEGIDEDSFLTRSQLYNWTTRASFVKVENCLYDSPLGRMLKAPRLIQGVCPEFICLVGPWIASLQNLMKRRWNVDNFITFTSGINALNLGTKFMEHGGRLFEDDIGSFDASIAKIWCELEVWLSKMFGCPRAVAALMIANIKTHGYTQNGYKYKVEATRKSGDPFTSLFNSVLNALFHVFLYCKFRGVSLDQAMIELKMLVQGDDNAGSHIPQVDLPWQFGMNKLGFESKAAYRASPTELEFCSMRLYPVGESFVFGPKPGKVLAKFGYIIDPPNVPREQLMRGIALGLEKQVGFIPPLRAIIDRVLELTDGHEAYKIRKYEGHLLDYSQLATQSCVVTGKAVEPALMCALYEQYGWDYHYQAMWEHELSTMQLGDKLNFPLLDLLLDRDTSGPQQIF